jgi:RNA polymerase sigma-70 factor (ECF subfamily)
MFVRTVDRAFARFQRTGQAAALALVFDRTAPELLRLARHLAARGVAAEDLLQQTFVTAIEHKAGYDPTQPVLPWLVGILGNHARVARRRQQRAVDAARVRRADDAVDPAHEAAAAELAQELERTIDRLPEPYRPVLRLHLRHGLEPREIARSLERPDGTVRAQLHRGLDALGRLLPAGIGAAAGAHALPGGLASVRATVLQTCGGLAGGAWGVATAFWMAIMVFDKKVWAGAAAALVCCVAAVVGFVAAPPPPEPAGFAAAEPAVGGLVAPVAAEAPRAPERAAAAVAEPVVAAPAVPEPTDAFATLCVRIVDRDDTPIAGIGIGCSPGGVPSLQPMPVLQATDATGQVTFRIEPGRVYHVEAECAGVLGSVQAASAATTTFTTYAVRGVHVTGRVLDADGAAVAGASVLAHGLRVEGRNVATTDADGRFEVRHVSPRLELQARAAGHRASPIRAVAGEPGSSESIELRLAGRGCVLAGRVTNPDGRPAADVLVSFLPHVPSLPLGAAADERAVQVRTGADGTFRTDEAPAGDVIVTAAGDGERTAPGGTRTTTGPRETFVELWLQVPAAVEGRLTERGEPLVDVVVSALAEPTTQPLSYLFNLLGMRMATTDVDGRFRLAGLAPGRVSARALRDGATQIAQATWELAAGDTKVWDVDVAGHELCVRVEPAVPPGSGGRWFVMARRDGSMQASSQPANADGVVTFRQQQPGRYAVSVTSRAGIDGWFWLARIAAEVPGPDVVVRVPAERLLTHELRGRVVDALGAGAAGQRLFVREVVDGDAPSVANVTTGPDGAFVVAGLPPGRWQVFATDARGALSRLREVELAAGLAVDLGNVVLAVGR